MRVPLWVDVIFSQMLGGVGPVSARAAAAHLDTHSVE